MSGNLSSQAFIHQNELTTRSIGPIVPETPLQKQPQLVYQMR